MIRIIPLIVLVISSLFFQSELRAASPRRQWTVEQANDWYRGKPWLVGCNFTPSTAINQLEMWQADTFDLPAIDRELSWAEQLGFTSVRVFLHNLLWDQDSKGFLDRMDKFLAAADKHHIGVTFVLFDSCWDPFPKLGKQHAPTPGLHNSGWVQSPGIEVLANPARQAKLGGYVKGVIGHFRGDKRIDMWDIFNEPDNTNGSSYGKKEPPNKPDMALALLQKTFAWAREANPSQPLTTGIWIGDWSAPEKMSPMARYQVEQSDVINFHNYGDLNDMKSRVQMLKRYNRPLICTEFMARPVHSTFDTILPFLKQEHVAAYNWGFVSGKTQTIYPWDSWQKKYTAEPPLWFHDILRGDGTPYDQKEVALIKSLTAGIRNPMKE